VLKIALHFLFDLMRERSSCSVLLSVGDGSAHHSRKGRQFFMWADEEDTAGTIGPVYKLSNGRENNNSTNHSHAPFPRYWEWRGHDRA
jgi:hypothetical protein